MTFKIYPEYKRLFFEIIIFPDKQGMISYIQANKDINDLYKQSNLPQDFKGLEALTVDREIRVNGKTTPYCGVILFTADNVNERLVSHECSHATTYYLNRLNFDFSKLYECDERYATIQGQLNHQFWQTYRSKWNNSQKS